MTPAEVHLGRDGDLNHINGNQFLKDQFTFSEIEQRLPWFFAWARARGWTDEEIANTYRAEAEHQNAFWRVEGGNYMGRPQHHGNIIYPSGRFRQTFTLDVASGTLEGQGPGYHQGQQQDFGATEWRMDRANWKTRLFPRVIAMRTTNAGVDSGFSAWSHHTKIKGMRFHGGAPDTFFAGFGDGNEDTPLFLWDLGENSEISDLYITNWKGHGVTFVRGTPAGSRNVSTFNCGGWGQALIGGGNLVIYDPSGDECRLGLVGGDAGYGRPGWGSVDVYSPKLEVGTSDPFRPYSGMPLFYFRNGVHLTINGGTWGAQHMQPYCVGAIKGGVNRSLVRMSGLTWFGNNAGTNLPPVLFYDELRNMEYRFPAGTTPWNSEIYGMEWTEGFPAYDDFPGIRRPLPTRQRAGTAGILAPVGQDGASQFSDSDLYDPTKPYGAQPPPTCTWVTGAWSAWSACVNGQETRTRSVTSSVAGCTPPDPKPAETETRACTVIPPPQAGKTIDPSTVAVVINTEDPKSAAIANAYAAAWGIPAANRVEVALGRDEQLNEVPKLDAARAALGNQFQYAALCFEVPSRVTPEQSITSAMTFGGYGVVDLRRSELFNYTGNAPRTDKGLTPSWLVRSTNYIRRDAHGTNPQGQRILLLAKDGGGPNYRGDSRANQRPPGVTVWDSRNDNRIGPGEHPCNAFTNACTLPERNPAPPVAALYTSMYKFSDTGTETYRKGFYGDHVTSNGGTLPDGQGQTPMTYWLDRGACLTVGTVQEPWPSGPASVIPLQFTRVDIFDPLFISGHSCGMAAWASVEAPGRTLILGDGLCAPFTGDVVDPPTCDWVLDTKMPWSDIPCINGTKTRVTGHITSVPGCTPTTPRPSDVVETQDCSEPPAGNVIWATDFQTQGDTIVATVGSNVSPVHDNAPAVIENGVLKMRHSGNPWSEGFLCDIRGARKITIKDYTPVGSPGHQYFCRAYTAGTNAKADIRQNDQGWFLDKDVDRPITATMSGNDLVLDLPEAIDIYTIFGLSPIKMTTSGVEIG